MGNEEQAQILADHFASSVVVTRCHLVALVDAKFSNRGTRTDLFWVEMPNGTGNFRRKSGNFLFLSKLLKTNFQKLFVPFDCEPEFLEILVKENVLVAISRDHHCCLPFTFLVSSPWLNPFTLTGFCIFKAILKRTLSKIVAISQHAVRW